MPPKRILLDMSPTRERREPGSTKVSPLPKKKAGRPPKNPGELSAKRGALDFTIGENSEATDQEIGRGEYTRRAGGERRKIYREADPVKARAGRRGAAETNRRRALSREAELERGLVDEMRSAEIKLVFELTPIFELVNEPSTVKLLYVETCSILLEHFRGHPQRDEDDGTGHAPLEPRRPWPF